VLWLRRWRRAGGVCLRSRGLMVRVMKHRTVWRLSLHGSRVNTKTAVDDSLRSDPTETEQCHVSPRRETGECNKVWRNERREDALHMCKEQALLSELTESVAS
jgi:hypothetical protein